MKGLDLIEQKVYAFFLPYHSSKNNLSSGSELGHP